MTRPATTPSPSAAAAASTGEIAQVLRGLRASMLATGSFSFVLSALLLVPSVYMMQVYDRVLGSRNEMTLAMLTLLAAGLYAVYAALEYLRSAVLQQVSHAIDNKLSSRVFEAAFSDAARSRGGNPSLAMNDLTTVRQFVAGTGLILLFDGPFALVFMAAGFMIDLWLGMFLVGSCIVLLLLLWWSEKRTHAPLQEANKLNARASGYMNNSFRNAEVIQAMGMLPAVQRRWQKMGDQALDLQAETSAAAARITAVTKFVRIFSQSLALGLGALLVLEGRMTGGMMIAASILLGRALSPLEMLIGAWRQIVAARDAQQRLEQLLAVSPPPAQRMTLPAPAGKLTVENVSVAAPGSQLALLRQVSFSAEPGELLAIIGPSGAGKSTVARVLVGVWTPQAGKVRLDGADLATWPREQLAPHIGFLPQDVELFEGTVAENIARLAEPDSQEVVAAAQAAGIHDMVLRLPQGYDTPVGPGGAALSGGQRQRVGLARALYGKPQLLILDEPNANLDDVGENALAAALAGCKARGATVVVVSHRTTLLRLTDKILLMRDGQVAAFGPRDKVLQALNAQQPQGGGAVQAPPQGAAPAAPVAPQGAPSSFVVVQGAQGAAVVPAPVAAGPRLGSPV
ncbi:type I secretion system permease/ATPase [Azohydromonas lata]|uniref:type I secretion system permease/ATPase n=1 Tax=Azohydromonas lata TaxID=45677 RepID=UPI0009FCA394|nr:type I secretion system permease/ATPase [Azohydromonas lata]